MADPFSPEGDKFPRKLADGDGKVLEMQSASQLIAAVFSTRLP